MIKKLALLFLFFSIGHYPLLAQNFMHSVGANISVVFAQIETPYLKESFTMQVNHISWFPRYTLTESENSSFSIGSPLGAGVNLLTDNMGGGGVSWGFDVPLVADYNMGCMSAPDNESGFGGYLGAGFGYMYTSYKLNTSETDNVTTYGPMARAGIRFASGGGRWHTTVGLFFKTGLEKAHFKTAGFNVLMDF